MKFEKIVEKATSEELLEPDWEAVLTAIDAIRAGEFGVKPALTAIRRRCHAENPHAAHHALMMLEAVVKNCGEKVYQEIATRDWMEDLKQLAMIAPDKVKQKILEIIQCWAHAFRDRKEFQIIGDTVQLMKLEGHKFPTLRESDAMFAVESPPEWVDADNCHRCNVAFGVLTRKHHCRNCGQIFCDKCSGRTSIIPNYGIEREVRVCETCYDKLKGPKPAKATPATTTKDTKEPSPSEKPPGKTDAELQEEEELQLALALSQSEAETQNQRKNRTQQFYPTSVSAAVPSVHPQVSKVEASVAPAPVEEKPMSEADKELARYLNRDYWDEKSKEMASSKKAPGAGILRSSPTPSAPPNEPAVNGVAGKEKEEEDEAVLSEEAKEFVQRLKANVGIFVNRMKSNQARGRLVINDSSIQQMFMTLTQTHSELLKHMNHLDERRGYYEGLHDKVEQIRDAREAIDALRQEHQHKKQMEQAEKQRLRQIQMGQKLEFMRQQKHEYLERQRLVAIQRMQEQEREMLLRKQMAAMGYPAGFNPAQQQQYTGIPQQQQGAPMPAQMGHPGQMAAAASMYGYHQQQPYMAMASGASTATVSAYGQHQQPQQPYEQHQMAAAYHQAYGNPGQQAPAQAPAPYPQQHSQPMAVTGYYQQPIVTSAVSVGAYHTSYPQHHSVAAQPASVDPGPYVMPPGHHQVDPNTGQSMMYAAAHMQSQSITHQAPGQHGGHLMANGYQYQMPPGQVAPQHVPVASHVPPPGGVAPQPTHQAPAAQPQQVYAAQPQQQVYQQQQPTAVKQETVQEPNQPQSPEAQLISFE